MDRHAPAQPAQADGKRRKVVSRSGLALEPYLIAEGCVDLWHASFCDLSDHLPQLRGVLSEDERLRADRYKFPRDQHHFILARGLLRHIAALYLGHSASSLEFHYNAYGKPLLDAPLAFNVSHSGERVLLAFGAGFRLGVDIERINPEIDVLELATGFFSESEVHALRSLEGTERQRAFFRCWARKEAFLKGLGDGLSLPLTDFDVTVHLSDPPALKRVKWDHEAVRRWRLQDLDIDPGYMATVAVENEAFEIQLRHASETLSFS